MYCNNLIKIIFFIGILIYSQSVVSQNLNENSELLAAFQAQGSLKLIESRKLFTSVVSSKSVTKKDKCRALRELAIQDWKFYNNYEAAKEKLMQADSIGDYRSETWLKLSRIEQESFNFIKAIDAVKQAIILSESKADSSYAQYKYCSIILKQAMYQTNNSIPFNNTLLDEASNILNKLLNKNPTNTNVSDILLGVSLLREDGSEALKAWLSYHRFTNIKNAYPYLKATATMLENIFLTWSKRSLVYTEKINLITSLGKSRFYGYAKILAQKYYFNTTANTNKINKDVLDIITYAKYIESIKTFTNEYYRNATLKEIKTDEYLNSLSSKNEALYNKLLTSEVAKDTFNFRNFRDLIRSKFGAVFLMAGTSSSSITGLIFGHIVNERVRHIEQYGHKSDFTFTELDMMVSNGYPSWFWEDRGAGGFAIPGGFLRIKKMFKHLGINAWEQVTDSVKRYKTEKSIRDNLLLSTSASKINVIYSALAKKLELDALDSLYKSLVNTGLKNLELQLKFIELYDSYRDNATMFAHEGRHSLDRVVLGDKYRELGNPNIEYRARLSQIAFSKSPKLELANMINGIGSTNAGLSNKMIIDVIEKWIKVNSDKIKDFDISKSNISQIYKLSNEQIKSCIRNVDPFYIASIKN